MTHYILDPWAFHIFPFVNRKPDLNLMHTETGLDYAFNHCKYKFSTGDISSGVTKKNNIVYIGYRFGIRHNNSRG
jgi:hypothetical protein